MQKDHQDLRRDVENILQAAGSSEQEAQIVADHLVMANLSGHDSHGVRMPDWSRCILSM